MDDNLLMQLRYSAIHFIVVKHIFYRSSFIDITGCVVGTHINGKFDVIPFVVNPKKKVEEGKSRVDERRKRSEQQNVKSTHEKKQ